jgi:hypothetical protein
MPAKKTVEYLIGKSVAHCLRAVQYRLTTKEDKMKKVFVFTLTTQGGTQLSASVIAEEERAARLFFVGNYPKLDVSEKPHLVRKPDSSDSRLARI